MAASLDVAWATLKHLPEPFVLVDDEGLVRYLNAAGERLIDRTLDAVRNRTARSVFNLREAHDLVHGETTATWVNDARLEINVTQYPVDATTNWLHLALRYPAVERRTKTRPPRPHAVSEASYEHVESGAYHEEVPAGDEFWSGRKLENIIERLPTVVVAVSKCGRHVWQNQAAFETLGSIRWSQNGLTSWLERQWGSTHGDGTPFKLSDYPIFKTSILGQDVADYETCYEGKSYLFKGAPQFDEHGTHSESNPGGSHPPRPLDLVLTRVQSAAASLRTTSPRRRGRAWRRRGTRSPSPTTSLQRRSPSGTCSRHGD